MTKKQKVIALIAFVLIIVLIALICVSLQNKRDSGTADDPDERRALREP